MTHPDASGPRILLPSDDPVRRTAETLDRAEHAEPPVTPAVEYFLEPIGPGTQALMLGWHLARAKTMQISQPTVVTINGAPHFLVCASSPEFVSDQWAVSMAIELRNARLAQDAAREVQSGIQMAPAGLAMPPPGQPGHRGRRR